MADWYVSSAAYAAIAQFVASHAYSIGAIVRPLTAPAANAQYAFRCTTAGTSSTEPSWPAGNNATVTTGGATFTNVTGQPAYGWSAACGSLYTFDNNATRALAGDRIFLSSDHVDSGLTASYRFNFTTHAFGLVQIISVNRAGSVPPVASDYLAGAAITGSGNLTLDPYCGLFWQGVTFTISGSASFYFASTGVKQQYFKNCVFNFGTGTNNRFTLSNPVRVILDNTPMVFGHASQGIGPAYLLDLQWINTPSAIQGSAVPTTLFYAPGSPDQPTLFVGRGLDLSAITGTLVINSGSWISVGKFLFDSCKIASGVTRLATPVSISTTVDEVELVNCFDGTNVINERYFSSGVVTTDRSTYLSGGAQDDIGNYSLNLTSSSRSDFATMPHDSFWLDVENTVTGASKTATVEIVSLGGLNNSDIRLLLEYMGTSGNPIASFGDSLASVLTAAAPLSSSSNTWNNPPASVSPIWNPSDKTSNVTLTGSNLIATFASGSQTGGARGNLGIPAGKYYFELAWTTSTPQLGCGIATAGANIASPNGAAIIITNQGGSVYVNQWGSSAGSLGAFISGNICCIAIDTVNQLIWFRNGASGSWNATSGSANNPATGTGGISISAVTGPYFPYIYAAGTSGGVFTANLAGTFSGTVPSGFSGLPTFSATPQLLQVTFTPQRAGRVRGLVRLGKPSSTVWVDPRITIT